MTNLKVTMLRHLTLSAALVLALVFNAETARADTVELFVQTRACFTCTIAGPFFMTTSFRELTFTGSTFSTLISGPPAPPFDISLGTFTLGRAEGVYATNFVLQLGLLPEFEIGAGFNFSYFTAAVSGGGGGAVSLDFDNRPLRLLFGISGPGGFSRLLELTIALDDGSVSDGGQAELMAHITPLRVINPPQTVPEPATLTLLGTGLMCAGVMVRRRRRTSEQRRGFSPARQQPIRRSSKLSLRCK